MLTLFFILITIPRIAIYYRFTAEFLRNLVCKQKQSESYNCLEQPPGSTVREVSRSAALQCPKYQCVQYFPDIPYRRVSHSIQLVKVSIQQTGYGEDKKYYNCRFNPGQRYMYHIGVDMGENDVALRCNLDWGIIF